MPDRFDLVLTGGTVATVERTGVADIGIAAGRIAKIGELDAAAAERSLDVTGLHILPGFIDTQVHFREPGLEHKEDLESGSRSAVMGGVTSVFEMPNTKPPTTTEDALADKVSRATNRMHCDFAFFVGATRDNVGDLQRLETLAGAAGVKVFMGSSTGDLLVDDEATLAAILSTIRRRASFHAEDEARLVARMHVRRDGDPASHSEWRDAEAALIATERLVRLARAAGAKAHVLHVSTVREMEWLATQKDVASVEATPQHLTLATPDAYRALGARAQMNPPLRGEANRQGLWRAVADGTVDVLGSDHAPHTREEKSRPYPASPSGMPGVQTLVPIMLDHVAAGRLSLARLIDLTSRMPSRLFGVEGKGRLESGYDADLTLVDLKRRETITADWIASKCAWSPFEGMRVTGWPVGTIVRGHVVMWQGELTRPGAGKAIRFSAVG